MDWEPEFDAVIAEALVGKYVLVGVTECVEGSEQVLGHRQIHGTIVSADEKTGIVVRNPTTRSNFTLPPVTNIFQPAAAGEYRLKDSGEVVTDPDFLCTWTVYRKPAASS